MSEEVTELAGGTFGKSLLHVLARVSMPAAVVGLAGAFVADVLQPLAPAALLVTIVSAIAFPVLLLWAFLFRNSRLWTLPSTVLAIFLAIFSGTLFALQQTAGGEKAAVQGFIASRLPAIAKIQAEWLNELKSKIGAFQSAMAEGAPEAPSEPSSPGLENPEAVAKNLRQSIEAKATAGLAAAKNRAERWDWEQRREGALARVDDLILTLQEGLKNEPSPEFTEASGILTGEGAEKALQFLNAQTSRLANESLLLKAQLQEANLDPAGQLATLEDLARKAPTTFLARLRLGELYLAQDRPDDAGPHLQAALDHAGNHAARARALTQLGQLHVDRGEPAKAEPLLAEALKLRETASPRDQAASLHSLGRVLWMQGEYAKSAPLYEKALKIRQEGAKGNDPAWQGDLAESLNSLGELHFSQQQYEQAQPLYKGALRIRQQTLGWREHPKTAESLNNLAALLWRDGEPEKAEPLYREALEIDHKIYGQKHPTVAIGMTKLGDFYLAQGNLDAAEPHYNGALKMREELLKPSHPLVAQSCYQMAQLYLLQGKEAEAKALLERAVKIQESASPAVDVKAAAQTLNSLAELEFAAGNFAAAEKYLNRAMPLNEQWLPGNSPELAKWYSVLADVYVAQQKAPEAERYMAKAFAIQEKTLGSSEPQLAEATLKLAEFYRKLGRNQEAKMHYERLLGIVLQQSGPKHQDFILTRGTYADFLKTQMGMTEEASNAQVEQVIAAAQKKS